MSYIHVTDGDFVSENLLIEFARHRIGKQVAVSFKAEALNEPGKFVSCEPVNLTISEVLGGDIYFMVSARDIASVDDEKY